MNKNTSIDVKKLLDTATLNINNSQNKIEINSITEELICSVVNSEFASLWIFDEENASLIRERSSTHVKEVSMLEQRGVLAKSFLTLTGGIYNYLSSEKEYHLSTDNPDDIKMKSKIILPMMEDDELIGIVTAYCSVKKSKKFSKNDMDILETLLPFLMNIIYKLRPNIKDHHTQRVYIGERLSKDSHTIVKKIEQIKAEEKATKAPSQVLDFVAKNVHDIRTPANSLQGFLELLEEELDNPRLLDYIKNAKQSAIYINDLTTSILDNISEQRERKISKVEVIDTFAFFGNIASNFSANMSQKNIHFNVYIDPLLSKEIILEYIPLKRVLMNLLSNAYKFTPSHKHITFSISKNTQSDILDICIQDTGIGIAKEQQAKILEPYTQANEQTKVEYGGTGLGLCICANYIEELGGKLCIESVIGEGSTFFFSLPFTLPSKSETYPTLSNIGLNIQILSSPANNFSLQNLNKSIQNMGIKEADILLIEEPNAIRSTSTHLICFQNKLNKETVNICKEKNINLLVIEEAFLSLINQENDNLNIVSQYTFYARKVYQFLINRSRLKVLVVDDDMINIKLIKAMLGDKFAQIDIARDGEEGLQMLEEASENKESLYALVYLDQQMPKLKGTEVISKFRKVEKAKNLPAIFAVSISGEIHSMNQNDKIFDIYLGKPFDKKKIKSSFKQAFDKSAVNSIEYTI
jgi:signal transduction histidine kinase/ActR/RegA family two-component response regulator